MKPIKKYKLGLVSLSVWEQKVDDKKFYSFTFQRSYKDKLGEWKHTQQLNVDDLPKLNILLQEAYRELIQKN